MFFPQNFHKNIIMRNVQRFQRNIKNRSSSLDHVIWIFESHNRRNSLVSSTKREDVDISRKNS